MSNLTDEEWEKWHSDVTSIRALPEPIETPPWQGWPLAVVIFAFGWLAGRVTR